MYAWTERSGFLLAGDAVRLGAVIRLLWHLMPEGSIGHVSAASQALFAVAYLTRYLGFFVQFTTYYDFFINVLLVFLTAVSLIRMLPSDGYNRTKDSWTFALLAVPTSLLMSFYTVAGHDFLTALLAFSRILEVVAIVPQLVLFVREKKVHYDVGTYVLLLSVSCGCYVADWWHRLVFLQEEPLPDMSIAIITTVLQFLVTFGAGLPTIVLVSQKAALRKKRFVLAVPKKLKSQDDGNRHSL